MVHDLDENRSVIVDNMVTFSDKKPPKRDSVERSQDMLQAVYAQIPFDRKGELTSLGSIDHALGNCIPCLYWFQSQCSRSVDCTYCHIAHPGQKKKRIRPSKKTRLNIERTLAKAAGVSDKPPERLEEVQPPKSGKADLMMWELWQQDDGTWVKVVGDTVDMTQIEDGLNTNQADTSGTDVQQPGDEMVAWVPAGDGAWVEVGVCLQSI